MSFFLCWTKGILNNLLGQGNPIPGLYAGGMDAGGLYGDSYDVIICGGTLAFAVNSGRIAGKKALEYVKGGRL